MLVFALGCGWSFAESLRWSISVIIGKAWYRLVHRVKASIGIGAGSKTKLKDKARGWHKIGNRYRHRLEQKITIEHLKR